MYAAFDEAGLRLTIQLQIGADRRQPNVLKDDSPEDPGQQAQRDEDEPEERHERDQAQEARRENRCSGCADDQREHDRKDTDHGPPFSAYEARDARKR